MNDQIIQMAKDGVIQWLTNYVDWPFVGFFIVVTWVFNFYTEHPIKAKWLDIINRIPKTTRIFLFGILLGMLWMYFFMDESKDIGRIIGGIFAGMVVFKLGNNLFSKK